MCLQKKKEMTCQFKGPRGSPSGKCPPCHTTLTSKGWLGAPFPALECITPSTAVSRKAHGVRHVCVCAQSWPLQCLQAPGRRWGENQREVKTPLCWPGSDNTSVPVPNAVLGAPISKMGQQCLPYPGAKMSMG